MTSLQMQYFLVVAKHLSFTKAANELYVSQPSISKQIAALESELGVALFDRSQRHNLQLTESGKMFQALFQRMTDEMDSMIQAASRINGETHGKLRIGLVEGWDMSNLLGRIIRFFKTEHPEVELIFETHTVQDLLGGVKTGKFDAAVCMTRFTKGLRDVYTQKLIDLPGLLVFAEDHPLAEKPDLQPRDFKDYPMYVLPPEEEPISEDVSAEYFRSQGFDPRIRELPNRDTILLAISNEKGWALSSPWARILNSRCYKYIYTGISFPVGLVWGKDAVNPMLKIFIDEFSSMFSEQQSLLVNDILK